MPEKPSYEELEQRIQELEQAESKHKKTEIALLESEARHRELFVSNPHPMWIYDLETLVFLDVNNAAIAHYGYSRKEFLSMTIRDIRPAEDVPRLLDNVDSVSEGLDKAGIWRHIRKDGSVIDVEVTSHVLLFGQRRAELVLAHDITERKRAEEALRKSEEQYRSLIQRIQAAVVLHDADSKIITSNFKAQELLGLSENQMLGRTANDSDWKFLRTDGVRLAKKEYPVNQVITTRQPLRDLTVGIYRPENGDLIWVLVNADPVFDDSGEVQQVIVTFMDITDRKRNEEAINAFFDQSLIMLYIADTEKQTLIRVNNEVVRITGRTKEELVTTPFIEFVHPEDRESTAKVMADATDGKPIADFQNRHLTAEGEIRIFEWNAVPDMERKLLYAMAKDITEQKKLEAERKKLQAQLDQAQKMESVGRLAGGVAHDFNNMLGVIIGNAEMMFMGIKPEDPHYENLQEIYNAARRSADLTRQLLAFARRQTAAPKVLDLNYTVEGMLKMLRRLIGEDIDLVWKPCTQLGPVKVDPAQVDQILANLCVNARDAISGTGEIIIQTENVVLDQAYCTTHAGFKPGAYAMLSVSDNGSGMDKETQSRLFEPFFTTKEVGEGTGLGLATVYGIVKQNDAFIDVSSVPEQGTTFKIYLPRIKESAEDKKESAAKTIAKGNETVLLVEDEEAILRLSKAVLERFGYKVLAANTPEKAVALTERYKGPIHLLATDVVMPGMNGKELKERIEELRPHIKALFMSAYTGNVIVQRGILQGDVHFLQKPFSIDSLAAKVREVLDQPA